MQPIKCDEQSTCETIYRDSPADILRKPYSPPRVNVTHLDIQGGDTTHVPESQSGLWAS